MNRCSVLTFAIAVLVVGCGTSHSSNAPTASPTTKAESNVVTTSTSAVSPSKALGSYLTAHPEAVSHSNPVVDGEALIAVVGLQRGSHDHAIEVLDLREGAARLVAEVVLPEPSYDLSADLPIEVADVTGDGRPDFLVRVVAGDNEPGVVVSDDGGSWRLVPVTGPGAPAVSEVYVARDPRFSGDHLVSTSDDCNPDCASGHMSAVTWAYQRPDGEFRAA